MINLLKRIILIVCISITVNGQGSHSTNKLQIEQVRAAYENLKYAEVVTLVKSELEAQPQQPLPRLEMLLKYLALAQVSMGKDSEARSTMASLVLVNQNFQFQTGEVSPKVQEMYQSVRDEFVRTPTQVANPPQYLIKTDRRAELILKSIAMPGWGQIEAGQKRGYIWAATFSAALIGAGATAILTAEAHDDYLYAYDSSIIQKRYNDYNQLYHWRNSLLALTFLTYSINLVDISLSIP